MKTALTIWLLVFSLPPIALMPFQNELVRKEWTMPRGEQSQECIQLPAHMTKGRSVWLCEDGKLYLR